MIGVLSFLRTIICSGVAFVVWYILNQFIGSPDALIGTLLPVWIAGLVGGLVAALFDPRQAIMLGFTCGLLLMIGFLWVRHGYAGIPLGDNPFITLWPLWFPAAFYVGAHGYIVYRYG